MPRLGTLARSVLVAATVLLWQGCASPGEEETPGPEASVRVEVDVAGSPMVKALGDATYSVNRILLLPFKKISEAGADDPSNFAPVYASARQLDVNLFTAYATIPSLDPASTYRMLVLGYAKTDYNYNPATPTAVSSNFSIGAETTPVTLANFRVKLASPVVTPEFFSGVCTAYGPGGTVVIGQSFKPQNTATLRGTLQRFVSGLSVNLTGVPGYVKKIELSAEQLVLAATAAPTAGTPVAWQTTGDSGNKLLATAVPSGGSVTIEKFLLPTLAARQTRLFLTVYYGSTSEQYTVKVQNLSGVSSSNRISFLPNHVVRITGTYANIGLGFQIGATINLDDPAWDGYDS